MRTFPKLARAAVMAIGAFIILGAFQVAPAETIGGALAGAAITWAAVTWKAAPIVRAAKNLAHAFALTDKPCIEETRALSRAVFLAKE